MTKKWIAMNLLLLAIAGLLGFQLRKRIHQFSAENDLAKIQPARDMKQQIVQEKPPARPSATVYNPAEFAIVAEKNLFVESRSKEEPAAEAPPPETPPLTQKPILVGITIAEGQSTASIIDPSSPVQRGERTRRAQVKKIGDVYRGYTITQIAPDRIVLESGTRKEVIPLHEGSKRTQPGKTPILSTRVVSFGAGGVSGGTRVSGTSAAGRIEPAQRTTTAVPAKTTPAQRTTARAEQTTAVTVDDAPADAPPPAAAAPAAKQSPPNRSTDAQGREVIRTPFGDIVRPAR